MKTKIILLAGILLSIATNKGYGHCEIPCGIYDDSLRVELIKEHIRTIEKSMDQIIELQENNEINYNQLVRWITNKEDHANKIQDIVSQYFLHQRLKYKEEGEAGRDKYIDQLTTMHQLSVYAMKSKQTTNMEYIQKMRETIKRFEGLYFHKH